MVSEAAAVSNEAGYGRERKLAMVCSEFFYVAGLSPKLAGAEPLL